MNSAVEEKDTSSSSSSESEDENSSSESEQDANELKREQIEKNKNTNLNQNPSNPSDPSNNNLIENETKRERAKRKLTCISDGEPDDLEWNNKKELQNNPAEETCKPSSIETLPTSPSKETNKIQIKKNFKVSINNNLKPPTNSQSLQSTLSINQLSQQQIQPPVSLQQIQRTKMSTPIIIREIKPVSNTIDKLKYVFFYLFFSSNMIINRQEQQIIEIWKTLSPEEKQKKQKIFDQLFQQKKISLSSIV